MRILLRCIAPLEPVEQQVYRLAELEKKSLAEIAALTNLDEATISETLIRARKQLKRMFFEG
jgi:chlorophyllide a reductase subunit X